MAVKPDTGTPSCRLSLSDSALEIRGECPGIRNKLRFWRKEIGFSERTRRKEVSGSFEDLYTVDRGNDGVWTLWTLPGFAHKVMEHCRENGIRFSFEDHRTPLPEPDDSAFDGLRDYQMDAVSAAVEAKGGIIKLPTGSGKTITSAAIIKAFPRAEMISRGTPTYVFSCPDKDINRKNWEAFKKMMPDRDVGIIMSGAHRPSDDIVCCTIDSLENIDEDQVGVLICDEMHTASSRSRMEKIMRFPRAARWGVSATPTGRFDGGDLVAEGLFGPIVFEMTYKDMVDRGALVPITVYWIDCPDPHGGLSHYESLTSRDAKVRCAVVGNERMHMLVADILSCMPEELQTMCMVQYIEHMAGIVSALPEGSETKFVHGETNADKLVRYPVLKAISPKERKEIYKQVESGVIRSIIATYIYKQGVDFRDLSVVVNAAGGGSDIVAKQLPGRASRISDGKTEAFMIDFHHPWDTDQPVSRSGRGRAGPLLTADRQRSRAYEQLGFKQKWVHSIRELPMLDRTRLDALSREAAYTRGHAGADAKRLTRSRLLI